MTREEYIDFANALKNNYTIDFDKLPEFCDMAISALKGFEGMTNGEVFRAIYPNVAMVHDVREGKRLSVFADDWWNAPYKGVSE